MVDWSWRLLWWDLVGSGQCQTVRDSYELMFDPRVGVVVKTLPEGGQASLNLAQVSFVSWWEGCSAYLKLPHCWFAEVLGPGVCSKRH